MNKIAVVLLTVGVTYGAIIEHLVAKDIVYVAIGSGTGSGRLERIDTDGTSLGGFGILSPFTIAVGDNGDVFSSPLISQSVHWYSSGGTFFGEFATVTPLPNETLPLAGPLAIGPDGYLYVAVNSAQDRIERFDSSGTSLGVFAQLTGSAAPLGAVFDSMGNLFVSTANQFLYFDSSGMLLGTIPNTFPAGRVFTDIALDSSGNPYVLVGGANSVAAYTRSGQLLRTIDTGFTSYTLAVGENDVLYVGGVDNARPANGVIHRFLTDGTPLGLFATFPPASTGFSKEVRDMVIVSVVPEPTWPLLATVAIFGGSLCFHRRWRIAVC